MNVLFKIRKRRLLYYWINFSCNFGSRWRHLQPLNLLLVTAKILITASPTIRSAGSSCLTDVMFTGFGFSLKPWLESYDHLLLHVQPWSVWTSLQWVAGCSVASARTDPEKTSFSVIAAVYWKLSQYELRLNSHVSLWCFRSLLINCPLSAWN